MEAVSEIRKMRVHVHVKDDAIVKKTSFVYIKYRITNTDTMYRCQRILEKATWKEI